MKHYEFQNYITHRSASIVTDEERYPGVWFVEYYDKGDLDGKVPGCSEPGSGCRRFPSESKAINSALRYVRKEPTR